MTPSPFPSERPEGVDPTAIWIFAELHYGYLGIDAQNKITGVFPIEGRLPVVGRVAGSMRIEYRESVRINVGSTETIRNCCIASVASRELDRSFRALAESLANELGQLSVVTAADFARAFSAWERLFQKRRRLSSEEEQGLWGELYFLQALEGLEAGIAAWRGPNAEDYDFLANGIAIEVKTSKRFGSHHVSHAQVIQAVEDGGVFLASIWVGEDAVRGVTLPALIDELARRTQDPTQFEEKLLETGYSHADGKLYDRAFLALDRPYLYDMSIVPRVRELDAGVTSLSYVVQLDQALALDDAAEAQVRESLCTRPNLQ